MQQSIKYSSKPHKPYLLKLLLLPPPRLFPCKRPRPPLTRNNRPMDHTLSSEVRRTRNYKQRILVIQLLHIHHWQSGLLLRPLPLNMHNLLATKPRLILIRALLRHQRQGDRRRRPRLLWLLPIPTSEYPHRLTFQIIKHILINQNPCNKDR